MIGDPKFERGDIRLEHREEFNQAIEEHLAKAPAEDWLELLRVEDVIAGPLNTIDKTAADPQVEARNMVLHLPHPLGGEVRLIGNPAKMAGIEESKYTAPPLEGQHNDEILKGLLNYPEEKIAKLRDDEEKHKLELIARLQKTSGEAASKLLERQAEREKKD